MTMLTQQYPELLKPALMPQLSSFPINNEETIKANSLALIDLTSILRDSQMISSEIELPKLLFRMLQVIIENAGTQTGAFWLEENNNLWLQAESNLEGKL